MKKYLFIVITIIAVLVLCLAFTNISNAGGIGCSIGIKTSSDSLKPGDEFTLTVSLKNVTVSKGIEALGVTGLDYNKDVFELVNSSLNTEKWKWANNDVLNKVVTVSGTGETTDQVIGTIKFKVKTNAAAGSYTIKSIGAYTKPVESQVNQEFQKQIEIPFTVEAEVSPTPTVVPSTAPIVDPTGAPITEPTPTVVPTITPTTEPTGTPTTAPTGTPTTKPTAKPTVTPTNVNSNTSDGKTPFTGVRGGLGIAVIIALVVAVIAGIKYSKYNLVK